MHLLPKEFAWATLDAGALASRVGSLSAVARARADGATAMRTVLFGKLGTGKSSLAIAIARAAMAERDANGMYVTAPEVDRARTENPYGRGSPLIFERACEVPILVFDELGNEKGVTGDVSELLDQRQRACRQTIVVSVLSTDGLKRRYFGGPLRKAFGGALVVVCDAEDQPPHLKPVRRVAPRAPWSPPPLRCAGFVTAEGTREEFERVIETVGNGPVWCGPSPGPLTESDYGEPSTSAGEETGT